jgi:MFS family permease
VGYVQGFLLTGAVALAALVLTAFITYARARSAASDLGIVATYSALARQRWMYFAMASAFLSVLPFTVTASFHPVLLVAEGYTSDQIGWLITLRAIGAIFAGVCLASLVRSASDRRVPFWCCVLIGLGLAVSALFPNVGSIAFCLFVLGVTSGLLSVYFQLVISARSAAEQRGSAMSYGGIGWNLCNLTTPLIMGVLTDWLNVHAAFYVLGALLFLSAFTLFPLYRWAFRAGQPGESR